MSGIRHAAQANTKKTWIKNCAADEFSRIRLGVDCDDGKAALDLAFMGFPPRR
jgi:hypothetical protein